MRLVIALVALLVVGCGNAQVSSAPNPPTSPSAGPAASRDVLGGACLAARDDIGAITDLMGAMLTSLTQNNTEAMSRYRDDARAAATTAVRRLPEGYGTVTALFDYAQDLRDLLASLGPQPDARAARDATTKLVAAEDALASCTRS